MEDYNLRSHGKALGFAVFTIFYVLEIKPPNDYEIKIGLDPVDEIEIPDKAKVVVGPWYFTYVAVNPLYFVDPRTLKDEKPYWAPPQESA